MSMDARFHQICRCLFAVLSCIPFLGASHRTTNFVVTASSQALATEIGNRAEEFRRDLAIEWLGQELPRWSQPCPVRVNVDRRLGAGGYTKFTFYNKRPFDWEMSMQGSRERILDSVLPHEVTHTIFATHFGQPLPRWADEGACTTVEHASERQKQEDWLIRFIHERRGIPFNRMFVMTQYPKDLMPLYAQGHSVADYLIQKNGRRTFVKFVGAGLETQDWHASLKQFYAYDRIGDLQIAWEKWVGNGRPRLDSPQSDIILASNTGRADWNPGTTGRLTSTRPKIQPNVLRERENRSAAKTASNSSSSSEPGSWYARAANENERALSPGRSVTSDSKSSVQRGSKGLQRNRSESRGLATKAARRDTDWQSLAPESRRRFLR